MRGVLYDYNRFMFVRGNPLRYTDPSGHEPCTTDFCWRNRWYNAHGYFWNPATGHWSQPGMPMFADDDIVATVLHEAGIAFDTESPWQFHHLEAIGRGVWGALPGYQSGRYLSTSAAMNLALSVVPRPSMNWRRLGPP